MELEQPLYHAVDCNVEIGLATRELGYSFLSRPPSVGQYPMFENDSTNGPILGAWGMR